MSTPGVQLFDHIRPIRRSVCENLLFTHNKQQYKENNRKGKINFETNWIKS